METFDIFEEEDLLKRLGRNRLSYLKRIRPFLEHLATLPKVTPIRTRNEYLPIETTRRLINRLAEIGILKPEDETYAFFTPHRHTKPHPKTYAIDHRRLGALLKQHERAIAPRTQALPSNAALDILVRLITAHAELDNQTTHDLLLMNLRPELRIPYLRQLKRGRGLPQTARTVTETLEGGGTRPLLTMHDRTANNPQDGLQKP